MNCRQARNLIESYIVGDLNAELADQLEQHLKQCEECRRHYEEQRRLVALLKRVFGLKRQFV